MERTYINALPRLIGSEEVTLCGWVDSLRLQKRMQFLMIRDRTGIIQCVNDRHNGTDLAEKIEHLTPESAVTLTGKVVANPSVKLGGVEVVISDLKLLNPAEPSLPLQADSGDEVRQDWRFLDLRRPENQLIFRVQTTLEQAMRKFWEMEGFIELHSPKLMAAASESGAELFEIKDYFGREACLAQSPQFYKQMAIAAGFDKVFEIGPVFRAEPSFTTRHATEFTSVDVEIAWIESHEDVMSWEERWLQFCINEVVRKHGSDITKMFGVEAAIPSLPFPRITMREAHRILASQGYRVTRQNGDLDPEGERRICQYIKEKFGHEFVFVTHYPISVRPFYHLRPDSDSTLTHSFDLLYKGVEITTGAQREHRYDRLAAQAEEKGLDTSTIESYMNCFRYGCPPHGGFGLGLARLLMLVLGLESIRKSTFLFRGPKRITP